MTTRVSSSAVAAVGAVVATAVVGGIATDVRSAWYRRLDKPPFQPPGAVFGAAWTVLYALIAVSAVRTVTRTPPADRPSWWRRFGGNLVLNAGWSWVFFRGHSLPLATLDVVALQASSVDLARRTAAVDRPAALLLVPYLFWVGFASVLTGEIWRRARR